MSRGEAASRRPPGRRRRRARARFQRHVPGWPTPHRAASKLHTAGVTPPVHNLCSARLGGKGGHLIRCEDVFKSSRRTQVSITLGAVRRRHALRNNCSGVASSSAAPLPSAKPTDNSAQAAQVADSAMPSSTAALKCQQPWRPSTASPARVAQGGHRTHSAMRGAATRRQPTGPTLQPAHPP